MSAFKKIRRGQDRVKDRGAVLLTTLLVMAIMAALAVTILDDLRLSIKRVVNIENHAQAEWYAKGAEAFAGSMLEQSLSKIDPSDLDSYLLSIADAPFVFPLDGGAMRLSIRDGGDCVSLGAMGQAPVQKQFENLLLELGWTSIDAEMLTAKVIDWQDSDSETQQNGAEDFAYLGQTPSYRTANTPFTSVSELRLVEGVSADDMARLRPFICARAEDGSPKLSINTLDAGNVIVLAALISDERRYDIARQLLENRPDGGYSGLEQLQASPVLETVETKNIAFDMIAFDVEHIWIEAQIFTGVSRRYLALEFALEGKTFQKTFRRRSAEAFRPPPPKLVEEPS